MGKYSKLLVKILSGRSDNNIRFNDICNLLSKLGFELRTKGSHHIFYMAGIQEIINIQEIDGNAKPYQVKQIRELIITYKLEIHGDEEL